MKDFDRYSAFTKSENWALLCEFNATDKGKIALKNKELKALGGQLKDGEVVFALLGCNVIKDTKSELASFGDRCILVVFTTMRIIFLEAAVFGKKLTSHSIENSRIRGVTSERGVTLGYLKIDVGERILKFNYIRKNVAERIAELASEWQRESKMSKTGSNETTIAEKIESLARLHEDGALTDEEFSAAKQRLLAL